MCKMVRFSLLISFIIFSSMVLSMAPSSTISREQYIAMWKDVAIQNMIEHKIPASITLAQGILESGYGNSDLARKANNHFGIKCHDWKGAKFFKDDDKKDECFRSYNDASESYRDHSLFLTGRSRYASLFELKPTDYKGWARGLKKAGYATNPKYADLLIDLIEKNELHKFDKLGHGVTRANDAEIKPSKDAPVAIKPIKTVETKNTVTISASRSVLKKNNVKYIVAKKGDTYYRIAKEYDMGLWQLYRYNDFDKKKDVLEVGDIVYLQPKRGKSMSKDARVVTDGVKSLRQYSQEEGVKLDKLLKKNNTTNPDLVLEKGKMIFLR